MPCHDFSPRRFLFVLAAFALSFLALCCICASGPTDIYALGIVFIAWCVLFSPLALAALGDFQKTLGDWTFSSRRTLGTLGAFGLLAAGAIMGGSEGIVANAPSLCVVLGVPLCLGLATFRGEFPRFLADAFRSFFRVRREPCRRFAKIAKILRRYVWATGTLMAFVAFLDALRNFTFGWFPKGALTPIPASLLYAAVIAELVFGFLRDVYLAPVDNAP